MKKSKILVIADAAGYGGHYHAGDEAMTEVALQRLRQMVGRDRIILACPYPRTARATYGVKAIYMPLRTLKTWVLHLLFNPLVTGYRIGRCLWRLFQAEIVFKTGGGNIRGKYSKFPFLSCARRLGKPIIVVSQTIGPLRGNHRNVLRRQLGEALWIGVRDRFFSCKQLGLPVHFAPDDAVYLEPRHNALTSGLVQDHPVLVGISFFGYKGLSEQVSKNFSRVLEAVVTRLGATAVFIPHHAPGGRGDCSWARVVTEHWPNNRYILLDHVPPASAVMALSGALRLIISNRYHGVVFGLAMGVPTVALYHDEYTEAKMRGAFEQFQLEPAVISVTAAANGGLSGLALAVLARQQEFSSAAHNTRTSGLAANISPYELVGSLINRP